MSTRTIKIPKGTKYLFEVISELPVNCLFNKSVTGCGGTTIALKNTTPTVICVPYISLAENKSIQSKTNKDFYPYEVLAVYCDIKDADIVSYLHSASVPKIMVTYNSLMRVMKLINPQEYYLLIDEYHCLFTQYSFRKEAAMTVLNNFKEFRNYTFMTASPIEEEFALEELKGIDFVIADWEECLPVKVNITQCKNGVEKTIKYQIERILNGELEGNYYFFINSVKFMKKMITNCRLSEDNCRVIYSESNDTKLSITRGKATDQNKRINFITSCAFEGCDFYDQDGKIVIVSDGNRRNTLVDISTQFLQIAGRIRNSKYAQSISHVLTNTRYSDKLSYEQFKNWTIEEMKKEQSELEDLRKMHVENQMKYASKVDYKYHYVDTEARTITQDLNKPKIDLYNYKILYSDYASMGNLLEQYNKNRVIVNNWNLCTANPELIPMDDVINFEYTIQELKRLKDEASGVLSNYRYIAFKEAAVKNFGFIEDAINLIGFDGIRELKHKVSNIKRKIIQLSPKISETHDLIRISEMLQLNPKFSLGCIVTREYVKKTLNSYYSDLGIHKKATSTDIATYYFVQEGNQKVDGITKRVYAILGCKTFIKK